jgi:hypothetical protein
MSHFASKVFVETAKAMPLPRLRGAQVGAPLSRAGSSLMANLIEAKCDDSLPIHRQCQRLARLGFIVPVNTLDGYWNESLDLLCPIAQAVGDEVFASEIVAADDTHIVVVDSSKKRNRASEGTKSKALRLKGHLWCFRALDGNAAFVFTKGWTAAEISGSFREINGFVQCDD